jgi:predicted site-specific integrase-resolvase
MKTHSVSRTHVTPPELARMRGIAIARIVGWIRSGELRAINQSNGTLRPRYLISLADLEAFDAKRAVVPPTPVVSRARKPSIPSYV